MATNLLGLVLKGILMGIILFATIDPTKGQQTYAVQNEGKTIHCFMCPAGTSVAQHCTEDLTNSTCVECSQHFYNDAPTNQSWCKQCRSSCPKHGQKIGSCTPTTDKECICIDGFHRYPLDHIDPTWTCRPHTQCDKGEIETSPGNHTHDTDCEKCREDQFVNKSDPLHPRCHDCTKCPPNSWVVRKCSTESDAECNYTFMANSTIIVVTSTELPQTTLSDNQSQGLSAGAVFGISYAVFLFSGVIAAIIFWIFMKEKRESEYQSWSLDQIVPGLLRLSGGIFLLFLLNGCGNVDISDRNKKVAAVAGGIIVLFGFGLFGAFLTFILIKRGGQSEDGRAEYHVAEQNEGPPDGNIHHDS